MIPVRYTRNLLLRAICVVYLFAFVSFYVQIPGLYGDNGILPAKSLLENSKHKTLSAKIHYQPTLLWLAPYVGLDTSYALDVLALLGTFLAFTGFVSQKFCTIPLFAGLWSLYFSLYQVGQVFVTTQWDDLLLEAGFLCLLIAPLLPVSIWNKRVSPTEHISLWLVRWLLFRFLLTTGLVKLISGCPKWWDLTALNYHFESMVLPTPLSWYSHHLPEWYLKLSTVYANICEIGLPFLFFMPVRSVRITGFVFQAILQICIVLTGNFNFLNMLLMTLMLSLLDDKYFGARYPRSKGSRVIGVLTFLLNIAVHAGFFYGVYVLYNIRYNGQYVESKIGFTREQFNVVLKQGILVATYSAMLTLLLTIMKSFVSSVYDSKRFSGKLFGVVTTILYGGLALVLFVGGTVPLHSLHKATNSTVDPAARAIYNRLHKLHAINEYGLFKKMAGGVNGRPEIVLEGSNNLEGPWNEFQFLYKPSNVNHSLPFVAPYSPRLDWQIWWAATSKYDKEPWLLSLAHRILEGRPEVMSLLHASPFDKPPKYIRAQLYNYKYTAWSERSSQAWWKREKVSEYFPAFTKDSPSLVEYLRARNLLSTSSKQLVHSTWKHILDSIRQVTSNLEANLLVWSIFTAGCAVIMSSRKK